LDVTSGTSLYWAAQRLLQMLYPTRKPGKPKKKDEATCNMCNEEICRRYKAGERVVDLAREYGMTIQGIYRILWED
jgi:hypothetical protein